MNKPNLKANDNEIPAKIISTKTFAKLLGFFAPDTNITPKPSKQLEGSRIIITMKPMKRPIRIQMILEVVALTASCEYDQEKNFLTAAPVFVLVNQFQPLLKKCPTGVNTIV